MRLFPRITEAWFRGYGLGARVIGLSGDLGVRGPVWDQTERSQQCLALRHSLVTNVREFMPAQLETLIHRTVNRAFLDCSYPARKQWARRVAGRDDVRVKRPSTEHPSR